MAIKIFVVEDEADAQLLFHLKCKNQIRSGAWQLFFTRHGKDALNFLQTHQDIPIILSDINMPEMDGLTLLTHLAADYPHMLTIMITAYGDMKNIRTAMNRGAYDFLMKPIDFADLETTLEKAIRQIEEHAWQQQRYIFSQDQLLCLQYAIDTLPFGVTVVNGDGKILSTNPAEARLHGYTVQEVIGQDAHILMPPELPQPGRPRQTKDWQGIMRERINLHKDGSIFPVWRISEIARNEHGEPTGIVTTCTPVPQPENRQESYQVLISHIGYGVIVIQQDKVVFANQATTEIFGQQGWPGIMLDRLIAMVLPRTARSSAGVCTTDKRPPAQFVSADQIDNFAGSRLSRSPCSIKTPLPCKSSALMSLSRRSGKGMKFSLQKFKYCINCR